MIRYLFLSCIVGLLVFAGSNTYIDGVLIGPGSQIPSSARQFNVIDSFPAAATDYSMGIGCDGQYVWNDETFLWWFARIDPATGSIVNTFSPTVGNRDMTFDGQYLWVSDWQTASINKYDTSDCSVLETYYPPFFAGKPHGLAWDGAYLWVGEESGRIYKMTTTGDTVRSIPPPVYLGYEPRGLAFDGEHLWVGYQDANLIYEVDTTDGAVLASYAAPGGVPGYRFQQGLDFDGQFLWSTVGGAANMIYKIDIGIPGVAENRQTITQKIQLNVKPNPCVEGARITFSLQRPTEVRLSVIDVSGRTVSKLVDQSLSPGDYAYYWYEKNTRNGVYFVILEANKITKTVKVVKL